MLFDIVCLIQTIIGLYFFRYSVLGAEHILVKVRNSELSLRGKFYMSVFLTIGTCLPLTIPLSGAVGILFLKESSWILLAMPWLAVIGFGVLLRNSLPPVKE